MQSFFCKDRTSKFDIQLIALIRIMFVESEVLPFGDYKDTNFDPKPLNIGPLPPLPRILALWPDQNFQNIRFYVTVLRTPERGNFCL